MKKSYIIYIGIALCLALILIASVFSYKNSQQTMTYNDFITSMNRGEVDSVIFQATQSYIEVKLNGQTKTYKVPNPNSNDFIDFLLSNNVQISYSDSANGSLPAQLILFALIAAGAVYYFYRRSGNSLVQNANSKQKDMVTFMLNDIAGNVEAKAMVDDIIQFIKNPDKYTDIGAKMPRGILFYGPPGTGKTLMAKAIAGEAQVPFYPMSGSDFVQMYVGVGASRIRELFKKAKKAEKAVIFIDEIDAIGKKRGRQPGGGNDERDQTLNALLTEMSGFHERDGIVVIAATNRLDTLDEALTRPGRFDRLIEIGLPDVNARKKILELHTGTKRISDSVNLGALAKSTVSFSGAMLENLLNEAAIYAANDSKCSIEPRHIDKAFYTVIAGAEKADTSYIKEWDRKVTAFHEAGHALITKLLLPESYISKVTIIPSVQGAGGFSLSIPEDSLFLTKRKMIANMKVLLAGRASEELIFGSDEITTGASNDIEKVSGLIMDFINRYGMEVEFGLFNSNVLDSPIPSELLDLCRDKLNEFYIDTKKLLSENLTYLHNIASALLEKESLNADDIDRICCFS